MFFGGLVVIVLGYLIGSINSSIIVGKVLKNVDIRTMGSKNAGATNTLRTLGAGPAILVVLGDALKGIIAVALGGLILGTETGKILGGLFAIIGHNWPIFFNFKGGKGILTSAVVILMITPKLGLIVIVFAILVMAITRYVSLGSILGAILYPVMVLIMEIKNLPLLLFALGVSALAVFRHKSNIERLKNGTESKLGGKSSSF